jgi:hypothetical protein
VELAVANKSDAPGFWYRLRHPFAGPEFEQSHYRLRPEPFLSPEAAALLRELNLQGASRGLIACPHVPLDKLFYSAAWGRRRTRELREIQGLLADIALFREADFAAVLLVEVTGAGWERGKRLRDKRLRRLSEAASVPLARWPEDQLPTPQRVRSFLDQHLADAAAPPPPAPLCPRCGAAMVLRTARKGTEDERPFWGCTGYPECRGTRPR